jgi:hypothetical protein
LLTAVSLRKCHFCWWRGANPTAAPAGLKTGATKAIPLGFAIAKGCGARHNNGRCQIIPTQPS